ncbi:MAG TPA: polysaccharide deacetylase family protein [Burkholderiaceae bacterium]|nr:polysaccharide deacetylase family protein [Burkholderiaceae bacterium]
MSILIFHRVLPEPDPLFPDLPSASEFEACMRWVASWCNVMPLQQAVEQLFDGSIAARALAITFDDGYADNEQLAAPILRRVGLCGTFFVSTGFLDGGCMWNDRVIEAVRACRSDLLDLSAHGLGSYALDSIAARRRSIDDILTRVKHLDQRQRDAITQAIVLAAGGARAPALMMTRQQVRSLREMGMEIGAHTISHPILTRLTPDAAVEEIRGGKTELERILREPVELFAYPNGVPDKDYSADHAAMVRECGFKAAVSTAWGAASMRSDRYQLPRFTPWDRTRLRFGARLLLNLRQTEALAA